MNAKKAKIQSDAYNVLRKKEVEREQKKRHKKTVKLEIKTLKRLMKESIEMGLYIVTVKWDMSEETIAYFNKRGFTVTTLKRFSVIDWL